MGFDRFWAQYPRKVGKLDAQRAYVKALKLASADVIVAGVERYKANKEPYADWCHPATWLNRGRWMDEYENPRRVVATEPWRCPHVDPCNGRQMCKIATQLGRPERKAQAS